MRPAQMMLPLILVGVQEVGAEEGDGEVQQGVRQQRVRRVLPGDVLEAQAAQHRPTAFHRAGAGAHLQRRDLAPIQGVTALHKGETEFIHYHSMMEIKQKKIQWEQGKVNIQHSYLVEKRHLLEWEIVLRVLQHS